MYCTGTTVCLGKTKTLGPKRGNVKLENYCAPLKEKFKGNAQNHCAFPLKFDTFETSSFLSFTFPRLATERLCPMSWPIVVCVHFTSTKHRVLFVFHTGENKIKYIVLVQYNQYGVEYSAVDILFIEYFPHSHSKVTFHASPLASIIFLITSKYLVLKVW